MGREPIVARHLSPVSSSPWTGVTVAICCAEVDELPSGLDWTTGLDACSRGTCRVFNTPNGSPLLLCISGVGKAAVASAAEHLVDVHGAEVIVQLGFCGVLRVPTEVETLILVDKATDYDGPFDWRADSCRPALDAPWIEASPELLNVLEDIAQQTRIRFRHGAAITADRPLHDAALRQRLMTQFEADCVDMETAALARTMTRRGKGWLSLRVPSDHADGDAARDHATARRRGMPATLSSMLIRFAEALARSPVGGIDEFQATEVESSLLLRDARYVWHPFSAPPLCDATVPRVIVRANGVRVWDVRGRCYIDALAGTKNICLGHSHPAVMSYVLEQSHMLAHWPADGFCNEPLVRMAEELLSHLPDHFGRVFTNTGGSEAVETALRISRAYHLRLGNGSRHRVVACAGGYHGSTLGALSVTGLAALRRDTGPLLEGVFFLDTPASSDRSDIERALQAADRLVDIADPRTISCFLFEPTLGLGGVRPLPAEYLEGLCDIAHSAGALVIIDEVASGLGRTGRWFDFTRSSVRPDIVVCGKALSNGTLPLSATVSSKELANVLCDREPVLSHGHTYSGHPLSAEAGYRVLVALKQLRVIENVQRRAADFEAMVAPRLKQLDIVREVRCTGLWVGVECRHPDDARPLNIEKLSRQLVCRGVLHERLGSTLAFSPPLTIGPQDCEDLFQIVYDTLVHWELSDERRNVTSDITGRVGAP